MTCESGGSGGIRPDHQMTVGGVIDTKDKRLVEIDALRLLKDSLRDKPPRFKELPDIIGLNDNYLHFLSSLSSLLGNDGYSFHEINEILRRQGDRKKIETGTSVVVDKDMNFRLGPLIEGEPERINVVSILKGKWLDLPDQSGKILRRDKIAAFFHTHPSDTTFSAIDIGVSVTDDITQLYVTAGKRDIYLLQATAESRRIEKAVLDQALVEFHQSSVEIIRKYHHDDVISGKLHALLVALAKEIKIGYYSNRTSKNSTELKLEK